MRYAVIYDSKTGNTEALSEVIFDTIEAVDKVRVKMSEDMVIPEADVYFVGFPIQKKGCSMKVIDCLEQIEKGKIALFSVCGLRPTEKYKDKLEDTLTLWLSDEAEYMGFYLCQGKTSEKEKQIFLDKNPGYEEKIQKMLEEGDRHPDVRDLEMAEEFVKNVMELM